MKTSAAVAAGQLISFLSKKLGKGGGSAAPGLYALKLERDLVAKLAKQIPQNIIITGTNGKTTTARLLSHLAESQNLKVIRNATGSNLERGVASALLSQTNLLTGKLKPFDLGIWELDEAAFNDLAPKLQPKIIVFLNVFRDQLDRYGEIDSVVKRWQNSLQQLPKSTTLIINGDDANLLKLTNSFKGKIITFGIADKEHKIAGEHPGSATKLNVQAQNIKAKGLAGISFQLSITNYQLPITLPIPGIYQVYNALAAFSVASLLNLPTHQLVDTIKYFSPAFGRVEKLDFGYIFLIKNPTGATQVFQTLAPHLKKDDRLFLALNDNLADGTDVSWIWDANFEFIRNSSRAKSRENTIYISGNRAYDLALRLKYAGFNPKQLYINSNLQQAFLHSRAGLKGQLFILPTYTAMLELQSILTKQGIKKKYWEEN
ncbi:MAG: DUF1727 domain-containing protein [Candidatus Daviesbacteria bacterium]|nr:MAG: DUF1727 domain-containing protein [Candidatus Daviesbacteria bacterium]